MGKATYQETFGPIPTSIPPVDLVTFAFDTQREYDQTKPLFFDAADDSKCLSAADIKIKVKQLVAGFKHEGVKKGDTIILHLFNTYVYTPLFLGAIGSGAAYTGTNPSYTVFEMSHRLQLCKPAVIITAPEHLANVQAACKESGETATKIFVLDAAAYEALTGIPTVNKQKGQLESQAAPSVAELLTHGSSDWNRITDIKTAKETMCCMFSTSGTTGLPKVSQLSHYAIIAQNPAIRSLNKNYEERHLMSLPFFNLFASGIVHVNPLRWGTPMYTMARFDIAKYVESIHKYQITDTATAPLMLIYLLKSGLPLKEKLASLRYIFNGSAPVDAETLREFYSVLSPEAMISGIWGMSETGCQTSFKWFERDASGSVGRIMDGVEMKLLDEHGNKITEDNVHGEAYVRGPQLMTSYVRNPVATDEMIKGDWLRTGDVCYVSDGLWFVVDRKKELIKVRGWQVAPAELEGVLVSHPMILDSAVIGVPFGDSEAPRAFILRAPGITESELSAKDVQEFMDEKLAKFKSLTGGIVFVNEIPKNMTGKTVKKILKERYPYTNGVTV